MALLLSRTITKYRSHAHQFYNVSMKSFSVSSFEQQQRKPKNDTADVTISKASDQSYVSTDVRPIGERIKENTKTASYFGVILGGVVVTGALFLAICRELLSSSSPNSVYSDALKLCTEVGLMNTTTENKYNQNNDRANHCDSGILIISLQDTRIQDLLGNPIKGYGEETRRRRRQHVAHSIYERNGKKFIRMQFYIQGIRNKATVQLEKDLVCTAVDFIVSKFHFCIYMMRRKY